MAYGLVKLLRRFFTLEHNNLQVAITYIEKLGPQIFFWLRPWMEVLQMWTSKVVLVENFGFLQNCRVLTRAKGVETAWDIRSKSWRCLFMGSANIDFLWEPDQKLVFIASLLGVQQKEQCRQIRFLCPWASHLMRCL